MTTHVLMIVDMSGSMAGLAEDVRGGFNQYLADLESDSDQYSFTVTVFDTEFISLCTASRWESTPRLDTKNYRPRGYTALLDAVGKTILEFEATEALKVGDKVLVVVQTDGRENASKEFTRDKIKAMIESREETGTWSFVFLGAGSDTWRQASGMGFQRANTVSYDAIQTRPSYAGVSRGTKSFASGQSVDVFASEVAEASGGVVRDQEENK